MKSRLLNVDDYAIARYARSQLLRRAGFEVEEAATGSEALERATATSPELILLDVNLPDISGREVCRQLKMDPRTAAIPVLHVSATHISAGEQARALEAGADAYLTEPTDPAVLVATVKAFLRARRAEEALHRAVREWQDTFEAIADGIALVAVDGAVARCNSAFADLFGSATANLVGRPVATLWHGAGEPADDMPFSRMLKTGSRQVVERQREDRWFHVVADPILEAGILTGAVYIVRDVTEAKRAETQRRELLAREHAARVAAEAASRAKDQFIAMVSHELRTPLNAIVGWTRVLHSDSLDGEAVAQALGSIERNARQQAQLIDDLLDLSRIESGNLRLAPRLVDPRLPIETAVDAIRSAADAKRVDLQVDLGRAPDRIVVDPDRLQQVVWNLLSNALKFTPPAGRIVCRAAAAAERVTISVTDTGQGISPAFLPFVFDHFRQAEDSSRRHHGGVGLGLAIVRNLVELHGGTVRVESAGEGKGSTFTVSLPTGIPPGQGAAPPSAVAVGGEQQRSVSLEGLRILVVDDHPDTREILSVVLSAMRAEVACAATAAEAVRCIERTRFDVVVADIGLPVVDGYELIRMIRTLPPERGGALPAIAFTAHARDADRTRAEAAGYQAHIAKPFDPAELATVIAELLGIEAGSNTSSIQAG